MYLLDLLSILILFYFGNKDL